jgi:Xaa-Pro aminopeptidase
MGKEHVLAEMGRQGVDVLLLGREGNARYVSGAQRLFLAGERAFAPGCVVVGETGAVHVLSVTDVGIPAENKLYPPSWNPARLVDRVASVPGVRTAKRIGVDGLTPLFEGLLASAIPGAELVDGEAVMRQARRIKSPEDAAGIRASASVAVAVMAAALDAVARGDDDQTVIAMSMEAMAAEGTTTAAFEPRVRRDGERATVAVGVLRDGWEADVTRTVPGPSTPDALAAAIDRCCAGTTVGDLGADVHGIGLGYEVLAPSDVLEPGMVLSIGVDGARDTLLVTDDSPETLTG